LKNNDGLYDIIDIDPYGSFIKYLNQSITKIRLGGLLCLSATDLSVLDGRYHNYLIKEPKLISKNVKNSMEVAEFPI